MRILVVASILALALTRVAAADDKPWAAGVSEAEQQKALAIYREGNAEFEESRYAQALTKYREALKHWDHPAIRFNMAVCLINLQQPLEAYEHLEAGMKYGAAPLGPEIYAQGVTYKKLLDGQLTHLKVECPVDDAEVTLDGKPLLKCKGESTQLLMPGEHQVVATKKGFETETKSMTLVPGKEIVHVVQLAPISVHTRMVRRWSARTPWLVVGAGVGAAALGGVFEYLAYNDYKTYDNNLKASCQNGCPASMFSSDKTRAHVENIAGVSLLVVGGAGIAAGLVGVYLNLPRAVVEHAPMVTPTEGGAMTWIGGTF